MVTRCKFKCDSVTFNMSSANVLLTPVVTGSKENESFFKYTPYGKFEFGTINKDAAEQFVPGNEYFIDITQA